MFTLKETKNPVAIILDGKLDKQIIYLSNDKLTTYNYDSSDDESEEKGTPPAKKSSTKLRKESKKKKVKKTKVSDATSITFNKLTLDHPSHFMLLPKTSGRSVISCFGTSGSGKTFFCSQWIKLYKKIFPDRPFYLVSEVQEDESLDKREPLRISIDASLIKAPVDVSKLGSCVFLLDDVDCIKQKKLRDAVYGMRKELLNTGRHYEISTICTNHALLGKEETKDCIRESQYVVIYPRYNTSSHIKTFLDKYLGLSKLMIQYILTRPSRWICIHKQAPMFALTENEIFSLVSVK